MFFSCSSGSDSMILLTYCNIGLPNPPAFPKRSETQMEFAGKTRRFAANDAADCNPLQEGQGKIMENQSLW